MAEPRPGRLGAEILAGIIIAIILLVFFLPEVPSTWKVFGIVILALLAALNFLISIGLAVRLQTWLEQRARGRLIRKHQNLIDEFIRITRKLHQTLYQRSSDSPSLKVQGELTVKELSSNDAKVVREFNEKVQILGAGYQGIYQQIDWKGTAYNWQTIEMLDFVRQISAHLDSLDLIFETVYRQAREWPKDHPFPREAERQWELFRFDFNERLQQWRAFTDRFDTEIGYGTGTKAKPAAPLPIP